MLVLPEEDGLSEPIEKVAIAQVRNFDVSVSDLEENDIAAIKVRVALPRGDPEAAVPFCEAPRKVGRG